MKKTKRKKTVFHRLPKLKPLPISESLIPNVLYAFFASHGILSSIGMLHYIRADLVDAYVGHRFGYGYEEKASEQIIEFLNRYLTCLRSGK
jgi:hypothetical protein